MRQGGPKSFDVTLGKLSDQQKQARADQRSETKSTAYLGVQLAPASEEGAGSKGVVVTGIDPDGVAAEHGIKTGDVILNIGGQDVANARDVRNALSAAKQHGKKDVLMRVKSADAMRSIAVPIG